MVKIEEMNCGVKNEVMNDVKYIVCSLGETGYVENYLESEMTSDRLCLPAVKAGDTANDDGFFSLYQLIYKRGKDNKAVVESAVIVGDKHFKGFYDACKKKVCFTKNSKSDYQEYGIDECHVTGRVSREKYYCAMWIYF